MGASCRTRGQGHTTKQGNGGVSHQPRVPNGDDEVEVRLQARLLGRGVLLDLSHGRAHSHCPVL